MSFIVTLYCLAILDNESPLTTVCETVAGFDGVVGFGVVGLVVDGFEGFTASLEACFETSSFCAT